MQPHAVPDSPIVTANSPAGFRKAQFRKAQWRMLLATMFCYLFYYTGRQNFGWAIPGIQAELGIGEDLVGWFGTVVLWTYALGQAVNGTLGDKYGGRRLVSLGAVAPCA
jgi:MFS transporter, OPA family, glycerol-3-phosphate transporter